MAEYRERATLNFEYVTTNDRLIFLRDSFLYEQEIYMLDTETTGLSYWVDEVVLVQIGTKNKQIVIDPRYCDIQLIRDWLEDSKITKILHNALFDYCMILNSFGIKTENLIDTMILEQMLQIGISGGVEIQDYDGLGTTRKVSLGRPEFSLKACLEKYMYIHMDKTQQTTFINHPKGQDFTEDQLEYAAMDVLHLEDLAMKMYTLIHKEGMTERAKVECGVIPVLGDMTYYGINVDMGQWGVKADQAKAAAEKAKLLLLECLTKHYTIDAPYVIGILGNPNVNLNSPLVMAPVLSFLTKRKFESAGVDDIRPLLLEGPSFLKNDETPDNESIGQKNSPILLEDLDLDKPAHIIELFYRYNKSNTHAGTYSRAWEKNLNKTTGRLHTSYHQIGTPSGRITSSKPNLLIIPATQRCCFTAPKGRKIISCDLEGAELRILADLANVTPWLKVFNEGGDLHSINASLMFGVEVTKTKNKHLRQASKELSFGLAYGLTPSAFQRKNPRVTMDEAKDLFDKFWVALPELKEYLDGQAFDGVANRYVGCEYSGLRNRFYKFDFSDPGQLKHAQNIAKNHKLQSGNALLMKVALINIRREFLDKKLDAMMVNTVYDEVVTEAADAVADQAADIVAYHMKHCGDKYMKNTKMDAEAEVGDFWSK
jgi:DNA polymerase I-like protein with 3'-5' exonuclease and polymerase domains